MKPNPPGELKPLGREEFAEVVDVVRRVFGVSSIASMCRVAPETVHRWARGDRYPSELRAARSIEFLYHSLIEIQKQNYWSVVGWFSLIHPFIENAYGREVAPWRLLRDDSIEVTGPIVLAAARETARTHTS